MFYQAIEAPFFNLTPARFVARAAQHIISHPLNLASYTTYGRAAAAAFELFERSTRRYKKPSFGITAIGGARQEDGVTEKVIATLPFCRLLHFERDGAQKSAPLPKVLVVAPMSGHHASLLRGTVEALLADHAVYVTDWLDARMVPLAKGGFGLADYIDYILDFMRMLGPDLHVLAVCQPSPPVLAAVALLAAGKERAQPLSMTLMGGPVDTRINPTAVNRFATRYPLGWFERSLIHEVPPYYPGALRRVYPGLLQLSGFIAMNSERHFRSHLDFFNHLVDGDGDGAAQHRRFYDEYLSVMDLSADFYLQSLKEVFQDHSLPRGVFRHRGQRIDPAAIEKTALMTVEGALDDISGLGQTKAAHDLCRRIPSAKRRHHEQAGVGHYGIFNGSKWRAEIYPEVRAFIRAAQKGK